MRRFTHPYIYFLPLLLVGLLATSCGNGGGQQGRGQQQVQSYPTLQLQARSIILTNSYPATLEGLQTVEIRPRVQGYITEMRVDEGDFVNKGQVLFVLNNEEYEQNVRSAKADIEAAQAGVNTAEDEVNRLRSLVEKDIISEYRLQSAKNSLESEKSTLAQAKARLENARVNLGYTTVRSPTKGIIGSIPYRVGSLVSSSIQQPLTVVSNVSEVYAYFAMSERELLTMAQNVSEEGGNRKVQQLIEEMPKVNFVLADGTVYDQKGELKLSSGLINTETGSASFRALFPNPDEVLRSGASGNVQIPYELEDVIVIPKKATYEVQDKKFVYTVSDSNTVRSTLVQVRELSTPKLYVVNDGLADDDEIVISGMSNLQDGTEIKPNSVDADSLYEALTIQNQQQFREQYQ